MKYQTAKNILIKESEFLGLALPALMNWVRKSGKMQFSEKVVLAYKTVMNQ